MYQSVIIGRVGKESGICLAPGKKVREPWNGVRKEVQEVICIAEGRAQTVHLNMFCRCSIVA